MLEITRQRTHDHVTIPQTLFVVSLFLRYGYKKLECGKSAKQWKIPLMCIRQTRGRGQRTHQHTLAAYTHLIGLCAERS